MTIKIILNVSTLQDELVESQEYGGYTDDHSGSPSLDRGRDHYKKNNNGRGSGGQNATYRSTTTSSTTEEMMDELLGDINAMIESATSITDAARQIRNIVQQSLEVIDLRRPENSQLGLVGTIKDLRRETIRAVIDGDRAHLRYAKVVTEFAHLRRCLRRLGVIPSPASYGVHCSQGGSGGGGARGSTRDLHDSAGFYRDLDDTES